MKMPKKVLITGANGFTGRYMASEMRTHGYQVVGLGTQPGVEGDAYQQVDLTVMENLQRAIMHIQPDIVIHLAAVSFVNHYDPKEFYYINLVGTRNLLQALLNSGKIPQAILLASSANVYGNASETILSENTTVKPANDYAVSKLAMEYMAHLWMDKLPIVITRPFNYTGVGQSENFLIPKIVSHFRQRKTQIELGNVAVWRDFSDVRTVVKIYRQLIEQQRIGYTVNVCSGQAHSLQEVISLCELLTGHTLYVNINPHFVRTSEIKYLCGDPSLLNRLIDRTAGPSLRETLHWMLEAN